MAYLHPDKHAALTLWSKSSKSKSHGLSKKKKKPKKRKAPAGFDAQKYVVQHAYELGLRSGRG